MKQCSTKLLSRLVCHVTTAQTRIVSLKLPCQTEAELFLWLPEKWPTLPCQWLDNGIPSALIFSRKGIWKPLTFWSVTIFLHPFSFLHIVGAVEESSLYLPLLGRPDSQIALYLLVVKLFCSKMFLFLFFSNQQDWFLGQQVSFILGSISWLSPRQSSQWR